MPATDWTSFRLATAAGAGFFCFALGLLAYFKNRVSPLNRSFALFNLFLGLWNLNDIPLALLPETPGMFFQRLSSVWAALLLPSFVSLVHNFTGRRMSRFGSMAFWTSIVVMVSMVLSPWMIIDVMFKPFYREVPGPLYPIFIAYLIGWSVYGVAQIALAYRRSTGMKKNQLRYLALAFSLLFVAVNLYLATVLNPAVPPVFYVPEMIYVLIIAYAIVRYQLMDINLALRFGTLYGLCALAIGLPFAVLGWRVRGSFLGAVFGFLGPVVGGLLLGALKGPLAGVIDRLPLFRARYERLKKLESQKQVISKAASEEGWALALVNAMGEVLGPCEKSILSYMKITQVYVGVSGSKGVDGVRISSESGFVNVLSRNTILIRDLLDNMLAPDDVEVSRVGMKMIGAEVCIPIFGAGGDMAAVMSVGEKKGGGVWSDLDVTMLWGLARVAEEALRGIMAREEIVKKERLAAIGEMASVVSHEVRTPLAVIQNSAHFLTNRLGEGGDEKMRKHLGIIGAQTEALKSIVKGILDFSRTRELSLDRVRLNDLIEEVVETLPRPEGVKMKLNLSMYLPEMLLDRGEIGQALINLLNNAMEAIPRGGVWKSRQG